MYYNAVSATGDYATALTNSYASGANGFEAGIGNNTSSYGATGGMQCCTAGLQARAQASNSVSIGARSEHRICYNCMSASYANYGSYASGGGSICLGVG